MMIIWLHRFILADYLPVMLTSDKLSVMQPWWKVTFPMSRFTSITNSNAFYDTLSWCTYRWKYWWKIPIKFLMRVEIAILPLIIINNWSVDLIKYNHQHNQYIYSFITKSLSICNTFFIIWFIVIDQHHIFILIITKFIIFNHHHSYQMY